MEQPIINIALSAARRAGNIITRHLDKLDTLTIHDKNYHDFVSEVDLLAEQAIIETIHKAYPNHSILAEETGHIDGAEGDLVTWIVDPLDGTLNYIHGYPHFAVSIAVKIKNRLEYGLIYDPIRHEFFIASRGDGARVNDRRLRVSARKSLDDALLATGLASKTPHAAEQHLAILKELTNRSIPVRRGGSAALDLAYVAAGRLDGYWETGLKPWDMAAGALIIKEAGGLVSDFLGSEDYLAGGNIVAGNSYMLRLLLQTIRPTV